MPQWPWRNPRPGVDDYGRSPLWHHAAVGDIAAVRADLANGLDPTAADKDGYSSLHVAAQNGHVEMIAFLLESGADPNCRDRHGNNALWTAASRGYSGIPIIPLLLRAGANPDQVNKAGRSPQFWREGFPEMNQVFRDDGF